MHALLSADNLYLPPRLRDISLELLPGQTLGLLGINGAGKSSLLAALAGVLPLQRGSITVNDENLHRNRQARRHIGWLPQQAPLYDDMTVIENLRFAARLHDAKPSAANNALERFQLGTLQSRLAHRLSGGERMRLGLACCLVHEPEILLLDEPTAGLDPLQAAHLRQLIASLDGQHSVLIASHLLSDIDILCERALLMHDGCLVADENLQRNRKLMLAEFSAPPDDASLLRIDGIVAIHHREGRRLTLEMGQDAVPHMPEKLACHGWGLRLWRQADTPLAAQLQKIGLGTDARTNLDAGLSIDADTNTKKRAGTAE